MPGGDKTGPAGQGSRTGRGKGFCSGNKQPGNVNDVNRRRAGRRFGNTENGRDYGRGGRGRGVF